MNGFDVYRQQAATWTRIDMLLAAYDGTIARLERAAQLLRNDEAPAAQPLLTRAQRIVIELYGGLDLTQGQIPLNMQKLYLYVMHSISLATVEGVEGALSVLRTIREGLQSIRLQAIELERTGQVPAVQQDERLLEGAVG